MHGLGLVGCGKHVVRYALEADVQLTLVLLNASTLFGIGGAVFRALDTEH